MMMDANMEPTYATVKRTARTPSSRPNEGSCSGQHIYREYPCTINGTTGLVTIATEVASNCCETDSCLSYDGVSNGVCTTNGGQTAFLRLHEANEHLLNGHHY